MPNIKTFHDSRKLDPSFVHGRKTPESPEYGRSTPIQSNDHILTQMRLCKMFGCSLLRSWLNVLSATTSWSSHMSEHTCALICVVSRACSDMCFHSCALTGVLSCVRSFAYALTSAHRNAHVCMLSCVCSHMCAHSCPCSHLCVPMCLLTVLSCACYGLRKLAYSPLFSSTQCVCNLFPIVAKTCKNESSGVSAADLQTKLEKERGWSWGCLRHDHVCQCFVHIVTKGSPLGIP